MTEIQSISICNREQLRRGFLICFYSHFIVASIAAVIIIIIILAGTANPLNINIIIVIALCKQTVAKFAPPPPTTLSLNLCRIGRRPWLRTAGSHQPGKPGNFFFYLYYHPTLFITRSTTLHKQ